MDAIPEVARDSLMVWVRRWPLSNLMAWANTAFPPLHLIFDSDAVRGREGRAMILGYNYGDETQPSTLSIEEDTEWTTVEVYGPVQNLPWARDRDFARAIYGFATREVRWWPVSDEGYDSRGDACWVLDQYGERTIVPDD